MGNRFQPTRIEVLGEVWKGVRSKFNKENLPKTSRGLKDFSVAFGTLGAHMMAMPYAIPSYLRSFRGSKSDGNLEMNPVEDVGAIAGIVTGLVADFGQIGCYIFLIDEGHPEALLIPAVTNVVSGMYEIGRSLYRNAKQRVLEGHNVEGLEATLQTTEPSQE